MSNTTLIEKNNSKSLRGFALYVGLSDESLFEKDEKLRELVDELKKRIGEVDPLANTYASLAFAPTENHADNLSLVRLALGEPKLKQQVQGKNASAARKTGVTVDFTRGKVFIDGHDAGLNYREFKLIKFFVLREGISVTREEIFTIFGEGQLDASATKSRAVDVQIRRLRAKLGEYQQIIQTVRGEGYRFERHADVYIKHRQAQSPDLI